MHISVDIKWNILKKLNVKVDFSTVESFLFSSTRTLQKKKKKSTEIWFVSNLEYNLYAQWIKPVIMFLTHYYLDRIAALLMLNRFDENFLAMDQLLYCTLKFIIVTSTGFTQHIILLLYRASKILWLVCTHLHVKRTIQPLGTYLVKYFCHTVKKECIMDNARTILLILIIIISQFVWYRLVMTND